MSREPIPRKALCVVCRHSWMDHTWKSRCLHRVIDAERIEDVEWCGCSIRKSQPSAFGPETE